jgi:small-conductance mechanosensitive channel
MVLTGALVALSVVAPSFQTKDLINTLGIGGLAVGFAFRDIFQNFLAGIILLLTQPFQIGDQIAVGSFEGTIETIETRASTIRTFDGRRVVIPNATLFTETVSVNTAFGKLRSTHEIQIKAADDIEATRNELLDAIREVPDVLPDPEPAVLVSGLDEEKVTLLATWWTPPQHDQTMLIRHRVLDAIRNALAKMKPAPAMAPR